MSEEIRYKKHARPGRKTSMIGMVFCLICLVLAACGGTTTVTTQAPAGLTATSPTVKVRSTDTPAPIVTPQPRAILLAPEGSDPQHNAALQTLLSELAADSGLKFEMLKTLSPSDLTPDVHMVVALPPDPGLAALAAAAPQTKFLAIDLPDLATSANLITTSTQSARPDQQGFLAGYLASLITPDWRVGVISTSEDPAGKAQRQGFLNGAVFYCGLCRPAYPPFVQYPVYAGLASGAGSADLQAAADSLIVQGVTTVYVAPGAGDESLYQYLANQGVNLIGGVTAPQDLLDNWVATISGDWLEGVRLAWDAALNGQVNSGNSLPMAITDINENLLSVGRQRLAEQTRDELASGLIDTGIDPLTGDLK